jgi:hypothetical protein
MMSRRPPHLFSIRPFDYLCSRYPSASLAAQGLWFRMQMVMCNTERYGYLQADGAPMPDWMVALRTEISIYVYRSALNELDRIGLVPREARSGIIYSNMMLVAADIRADGRLRTRRSRLKSIDAQNPAAGYVYYILSDGQVKIAFGKNPWASLASLQEKIPRARLIAMEKGSRESASERQTRFGEQSLGQGWFRHEGQLHEFIEHIKSAALAPSKED